jgi:hypothetical protein
MKFSQLTSAQRSALSVLCNVGPTRTDKLARSMQFDNAGAANSLCGLRKIGLVFSKERGAHSYAEWEVTEFGRALFDGRPLTVEPVTPPAHLLTQFAVCSNFKVDATGSKAQALLAAEEASIRTGVAHTVIALVAQVTPPEQPRAQIVLL